MAHKTSKREPKEIAAFRVDRRLNAGHFAMLAMAIFNGNHMVRMKGLSPSKRKRRIRNCEFLERCGYLEQDSYGIFHITPQAHIKVAEYHQIKKEREDNEAKHSTGASQHALTSGRSAAKRDAELCAAPAQVRNGIDPGEEQAPTRAREAEADHTSHGAACA